MVSRYDGMPPLVDDDQFGPVYPSGQPGSPGFHRNPSTSSSLSGQGDASRPMSNFAFPQYQGWSPTLEGGRIHDAPSPWLQAPMPPWPQSPPGPAYPVPYAPTVYAPGPLQTWPTWPSAHHAPPPKSTSMSRRSSTRHSPQHSSHEPPASWRPSFRPRSRLSSFLLSTWRNTFGRRIKLNPLLKFNGAQPLIIYDLRLHPSSASFSPQLNQGSVPASEYAPACNPAVDSMRIYHDRLPWNINVRASNPSLGVTVRDVLKAIYANMMMPIHDEDFWNKEMDGKVRDKIMLTWRQRCAGNTAEARQGIRRVDFLQNYVVFLGLEKGDDGAWVMRTRKIPG